MEKQSDKVYFYVKEETKTNILNGKHNFENTNATTIGIDLNIHRANVSRILNLLHKEEKLIKQKGRPTLYISKEILLQEYPYLSIPITLEIDDDISNYVNKIKNKPTSSMVKYSEWYPEEFTYNKSFRKNFNKTFPIFFLPKDELKIIVITGEKGTGKKYLLNKIIEYAKQSKMIPFNNQVLHYKHIPDSNTIDKFTIFLEKYSSLFISTICIQIVDLKSDLMLEYISIIELFFRNIKGELPIIAFCTSNNLNNKEYMNISRYNALIPSFNTLSIKNKIYIAFKILYFESERHQKKISVSKKMLFEIISDNYKYNIDGLKNNIFHKLSIALFNSSNDTLYIKNNSDNNTKAFETFNIEDNNDLYEKENFWKQLPNNIIISPNNKTDLISLLESESDKIETQKSLINSFFLKVPINIKAPYQKKSIENRIFQVLLTTDLKYDFTLTYFLVRKIIHRVNGISKVDLNNQNNTIVINQISNEVYHKIFKILDTKEADEKFIKKLLSIAIESILEVKIPVLIATKSSRLDNILTVYFNTIFGKRMFFTLPDSSNFYNKKENINQKINSLDLSINNINRGNGVLLLNDFKKNSELYKKLLLQLKNQAYSIGFPSIETIQALLNVIDQEYKNIFSISPVLIQERKKNITYFSQHTLDTSEERLVKFVKPLSAIFVEIDTKKITESAYKVLSDLSNSMNFHLSNALIFDFLFVSNAIANENSKKDSKNTISNFDDSNTFSKELSNLFNKNSILKKFNFNNADINSLCIIIDNYTKKEIS